MRRILSTAALAILLLGCRHSWSLEADLDSTIEKLEKLSNLKFESRPKIVEISRADWHGRVDEWRDRNWNPEVGRAYNVLWRKLGVIPEDADAHLAGWAMWKHRRGFYDHYSQTIYHLTDTPPERAEKQLAHALMHDLQKQHTPYFEITDTSGYFDDVSWAYRAAAEGEAIIVEKAWPRGGKFFGMADEFGLKELGEPAWAVRWEYWPWFAGGRMVLLRSGPVYKSSLPYHRDNPPISTEQVLHPRRLDPPIAVFAPDLSKELGKGWRLVIRTVLGELSMADWVFALKPELAPEPLTPDHVVGLLPDEFRWGGDVVQVYRNGDRWAVVAWTVWDTAESATKFHELVGGAEFRRQVSRMVVVAYGGGRPLARILKGNALLRVPQIPFRDTGKLQEEIRRRLR